MATPQKSRNKWMALAVLAMTQLVVVLDGTIINIALPSAQADLDLSDVQRQWVVTAYALAFGALMLIGGRLADFWGRKRTFMVGMLGFGIASLYGGLAQTGADLIIARGLQGVFAAMLAPAAPHFHELWQQHAVTEHAPTIKRVVHSAVGNMELDCDILTTQRQDLRIMMYTAEPGSESDGKLALLGTLGTEAMHGDGALLR